MSNIKVTTINFEQMESKPLIKRSSPEPVIRDKSIKQTLDELKKKEKKRIGTLKEQLTPYVYTTKIGQIPVPRIIIDKVFRDPKQAKLLELANLYMGQHEFQKAKESAETLIKTQYASSPRPLFFDEAIFLISDIQRINAYANIAENQKGSKELFIAAFKTLYDNFKQLCPFEYGYKSAYSGKMLGLIAEYREIFHEDLTEIKGYKAIFKGDAPFNISDLLVNTTERYNKFNSKINIFNIDGLNGPINRRFEPFSPEFNDNFIAVRSMLSYSKILTLQGNLMEAEKEYDKILAFVDSVKHASNFKKMLRIRVPVKFASWGTFDWFNQYDIKNFKLFEAQAYRIKANIELFKLLKSKGNNYKTTESYFSKAHKKMKEIREESKTDFYMDSKWEERKEYCTITLEYALVLLRQKSEAKATGLLKDIIEIYNTSKDPLLLNTYIRANGWLKNITKKDIM